MLRGEKNPGHNVEGPEYYGRERCKIFQILGTSILLDDQLVYQKKYFFEYAFLDLVSPGGTLNNSKGEENA